MRILPSVPTLLVRPCTRKAELPKEPQRREALSLSAASHSCLRSVRLARTIYADRLARLDVRGERQRAAVIAVFREKVVHLTSAEATTTTRAYLFAHAAASSCFEDDGIGRANQSAGCTLPPVSSSIRRIVHLSGKRVPLIQRLTVTCETCSSAARSALLVVEVLKNSSRVIWPTYHTGMALQPLIPHWFLIAFSIRYTNTEWMN